MEDVFKYVKRLEHRKQRIEERLKSYENEDKLSKHGMWTKGYWYGKLTEIEDTLDSLNLFIKEYKDKEFIEGMKDIQKNFIPKIKYER